MSAPLTVAITTASGKGYRWGPDEWDAANVPQSITFSTAMPGGFKTATIVLPRRIDQEYPDLNLLDTVQILGPGNKIVWEGRIQQLPRSHDETFSITIGAVGWAAHLEDDISFREIYRDIDLSHWISASRAWKTSQALASGPVNGSNDIASDSASGLPSLRLHIDGAWKEPTLPCAEAWFDASPGALVAKVYYDFSGVNNTAFTLLWVSSLADNAATETSGDLYTATTGSGTIVLPVPRRWFAWHWFYPVTNQGAEGAEWWLELRRLAVYGNHGLTLRGTEPEAGFYASDIIADAVSRAAPLLNFSTGAGGSIQDTTFPIPQMAFLEPSKAFDVVMACNGYHLWDWAVWENRTFYFREPNPERLTWDVRLSDGARLELEGTQIENVFNGVLVEYTDPAGEKHTVGPPGSGADATSESLVDTSSSNPVNEHGIPKKWAVLSISQTVTVTAAEQLGAVYLAEKAIPQRRGSLALTGTVMHPSAGPQSVYEMRAGDWVRIQDHPTDVARKIISTEVDTSTQSITCELDNTSQKLDAILERLGVALVGVM